MINASQQAANQRKFGKVTSLTGLFGRSKDVHKDAFPESLSIQNINAPFQASSSDLNKKRTTKNPNVVSGEAQQALSNMGLPMPTSMRNLNTNNNTNDSSLNNDAAVTPNEKASSPVKRPSKPIPEELVLANENAFMTHPSYNVGKSPSPQGTGTVRSKRGFFNKKGLNQVVFPSHVRGFYCAIKSPEFRIIHDQQEYDALWDEMFSSQSSKPIPIKVNFKKEQMYAIFLGTKKSGGYAVDIVNIREEEESMVVYYKSRVPPPNEHVPKAETQPFHIVAGPRSDKQVQFKQLEDAAVEERK